jgi:hypothetical protein
VTLTWISTIFNGTFESGAMNLVLFHGDGRDGYGGLRKWNLDGIRGRQNAIVVTSAQRSNLRRGMADSEEMRGLRILQESHCQQIATFW